MNKTILLCGMALFGSTALAQAPSDSIFLRAQRMVSDGNGAAGRALVDSMVRAARRGSPAYAEAIFWRAALAPTSQLAEQDYRRLVVEYPLYARSGEVLLRLAQLELLRGNRDAATVHLRRIRTEHPEYANQAAASYWLGRVLFEKNDISAACGAIADAKRLVKQEDVELKNQIEYQEQQCAGVAVATADTERAEVSAPPDPVSTSLSPVPAAEKPVSGSIFSVQVAAYGKLSQANVLAVRLKRRGFPARVDGTKPPFRVRIGKYRTHAEAASAQQRIRKRGIAGIVVRAE